MKWFILLVLVGVAEIVTIGKLHALMGTNKLVLLYLITTAIGTILLYLRLPKFKESFRLMKKFDKKLRRKYKKAHLDENTRLTESQIMKFAPSFFFTCFMMAGLLIAVPGILSDMIGVIIAIPIVSDYLSKRQLESMLRENGHTP